MAMNKKEQALVESLTIEAAQNRALRWSDGEESPDIPVPDGFNQFVNGWSFNAYRGVAYETWSCSVTHGDGHITEGGRPGSASQRGIRQYSTEEKALIAMRRSLERQFASSLNKIDEQILKLKSQAA